MENYKKCVAIMYQLEFISKGALSDQVKEISTRLTRPYYENDEDVTFASGFLNEALMIYRCRGQKLN